VAASNTHAERTPRRMVAFELTKTPQVRSIWEPAVNMVYFRATLITALPFGQQCAFRKTVKRFTCSVCSCSMGRGPRDAPPESTGEEVGKGAAKPGRDLVRSGTSDRSAFQARSDSIACSLIHNLGATTSLSCL
jgi:hypothetical protein